MGYTFPLESYGGDPVELVPVIASYDGEGHIRPLYVRINDDKYQVISSWLKSSFANCMDFHCTLSRDNRKYSVVMTYHIRETVWTIPKYLAK